MSAQLEQTYSHTSKLFGGLSRREALFVEYYLADPTGNATSAARKAGFTGTDDSLWVTASRLLRRAKVRNEIRRRLGQHIASADEVLSRLTKHSRADIAEILNEDGSFDLNQAKRRQQSDLLKKVKFDKDSGRIVEIELHDAAGATKTLAQFHGLLDKGDSGTTNININIEKIELGSVLKEALSNIIDITPTSHNDRETVKPT